MKDAPNGQHCFFMENLISAQLDVIKSQIQDSAAKSGRPAEEIQLIAVSKAHPPESLEEALACGQTVFGESRIQEARAKAALLPSRIRWHLIGHLQSNKVRQALPLFERIHSIDSLDLAKDVNRVAGELGLFPKVLLEINVAGESTKFGFKPETLRAQMEQLFELDRLAFDGLMVIPPYSADPEGSRKYFATLRELRDQVSSEFRFPLPHLSMGMSHDFQVAIEEGATFVRVGTGIFGERKGKAWKPVAAED
jgi:pyridoxal phosphate enzyme (YggS family)